MNETIRDKRTQLIEAAIDLFAKGGFWNTPTSRIAKHAGVSTGTLFNYFESKARLIDAVYTQLKQEYLTYVLLGYPADTAVKTRFEHIWFRYVEWGITYPKRHDLLMQLRLSELVNKEKNFQAIQASEEMTTMLELVNQAIAEDLFIELPIMYLGALFESLLDTTVRYAINNVLTDMERTRLIANGFEVFWRGITK